MCAVCAIEPKAFVSTPPLKKEAFIVWERTDTFEGSRQS
jgi:hypothetical protein